MTPNPLGSAMNSQLIQALAGAQGGSMVKGPMGTAPESTTAKVGQELAALRTADPKAVSSLLSQIKKQIVSMIPQTAFAAPKVTAHLSNMLKALEGAIKEASAAASAEATVSSTPIGFSAAQQPPSAGSGALPGMSGGTPGLG